MFKTTSILYKNLEFPNFPPEIIRKLEFQDENFLRKPEFPLNISPGRMFPAEICYSGVFIFGQKGEFYYQFEGVNIVTEFPCLWELNMLCVTRYLQYKQDICSTRYLQYKQVNLTFFRGNMELLGPFSGRRK